MVDSITMPNSGRQALPRKKPIPLPNCAVYPKYGGYLFVFRTWRGAQVSHTDSYFGNFTVLQAPPTPIAMSFNNAVALH